MIGFALYLAGKGLMAGVAAINRSGEKIRLDKAGKARITIDTTVSAEDADYCELKLNQVLDRFEAEASTVGTRAKLLVVGGQ